VLAVTSSLFDACAYLNSQGEGAATLVVIEDAGHWANSADLLMDLSTGSVPVIAFGTFADEPKLKTYVDTGFKQARWDVEELEQLNWGSNPPALAAAEVRIQFGLGKPPEVHVVESQGVDACGPLLERAAADLAATGGDDRAELALGASWTALTRATRWILPVKPASVVELSLLRAAEKLTSPDLARHLSDQATGSFGEAADALRELACGLVVENPKFAAFLKATGAAGSPVVIASNDTAAEELRHSLADVERHPLTEVVTVRRIADEGIASDQPVIIPGWYRADYMTKLLNPPVAKHLNLILWGFERLHYERWLAKQQQVHTAPGVVEAVGGSFRRKTRRTTIIVPPPVSLPPSPDEVMQTLELNLVRASAHRLSESSMHGASASDIVDAVVVSFKDGQFAFFEADGSAQVVTEILLAPPEQARNVRVRYKPVSELREGDLLLFHTGAEADAIRARADSLMEDERSGSSHAYREAAELWRRALVRYRNNNRLSAVDLASRLERVGCKRNVMTVRKWLVDDALIGPQSYKREVDQILDLTQDAELRAGLKKCIEAIGHLRGMHLQASASLAKTLLHHAAQQHERTTGDFGGGLVVAEFSMRDSAVVRVARRALRRLNPVAVDHDKEDE
jgi:hypothetical protein